LSNIIENGALHEFPGINPGETIGFQAVTNSAGDAALWFSITEETGDSAETMLTVPQIGEFARSMAAALYQVYELDEARQYGWLRKYLGESRAENPFQTAGDGS
jgi:hypothetical protein